MSQGTPGKRRSKHRRRPKGPPPIVVDDTMAQRILRGAKTQHRYGSDKPCKHQLHQLVPVIRKGVDSKTADPLVCHVAIRQIYNQLPGDISDVEAKAEGFNDRDEFAKAKSFRCRQVWVLTFEVVETPRLLHENPGMARSDYTINPSESVDQQAPPDHVVAEFAGHNRRRHEDFKRAEREGLPLHQRLKLLEAAAQGGDGQAARQLFVIRQRIENYERRAENGERAA